MPLTLSIFGVVAPTGVLLRARAYLPGGSALAEWPLAEATNGAAAGLSIFGGSAAASIADTGAVQLLGDVRQVTAQTSISFDASTLVRGYGDLGFVAGGNLCRLGPADAALLAASIPVRNVSVTQTAVDRDVTITQTVSE